MRRGSGVGRGRGGRRVLVPGFVVVLVLGLGGEAWAGEPVAVIEALGLDGEAPPVELAGYRLGERVRGAAARVIEAAGWRGDARAIVDARGRVRHVVVELMPEDDGGVAVAELARRLGPRRRGRRAQVFVAEYGGFLRGTPSVVIELLPPGERHVCGARDGFAAFFRRYRRALARTDPALAARLRGAPPVCVRAREVYQWATVEERHGGTAITFSRDERGRWRASEPWGIGHDDDVDASAP